MTSYRFDVISLLPNVFEALFELGVIGRAFSRKIAEIKVYNPRDFVQDKYRKVDDEPYGGGAGMILKPEPIFAAFDSIPLSLKKRVLLLSPQGKSVSQRDIERWSLENDQLVLICGQYEGFDERIRSLVDEEISLGDFVLTGGELPAMTIINGVLRLLPGTVGKSLSLVEESHSNFLLEHPHYTRPNEFKGMKVPEILLSGDHAAISDWRRNQSELRTKDRRPDLYQKWLSKSSESSSSMDSFVLIDPNLPLGNVNEIYYPDW
tara:strand:+ start:273 stop:1061 length:789 start_codon:yes stop_codon:yes gene_type:complete